MSGSRSGIYEAPVLTADEVAAFKSSSADKPKPGVERETEESARSLVVQSIQSDDRLVRDVPDGGASSGCVRRNLFEL